MPPADDQQNVNPIDAQPGGMQPAMPPDAGEGQDPMQPTEISPTSGLSDDMGSPVASAPGFGSAPDTTAPADTPAIADPSPFDAPSMPADVPLAAPEAGDVPPVTPDASAETPDAGDVPTFPPEA